jgi:hypothetical protein
VPLTKIPEENMRHKFPVFHVVLLVAFAVFLFPAAGAFAEDDDQFIQTDDYFISRVDFKGQAWIHVHLAKMTTPATPETKNEAEFMQITDGNKLWTKYYWTSRIATPAEVKIGALVITFDASDGDVYRAPENRDEARTGSWFMARITDTSDLYKGYVTVSGGYKVDAKALRIVEKK